MHGRRSRRCHYECRPPFGFLGKPCQACAEKYQEWMDDSYNLHVLGKTANAAERILPATDRERVEWLDQVAPVVPILNDFNDFTYFTTT